MSNGLNNFLEAAGKLVEIVPSAYEDALQPAVKETGQIIAKIPQAINAALVDIDCWVEEKKYKLEETKKLLQHKLENVDPEKIVPPEPYVAIPALQAISYSMDSEELRNMYANLLANAMNVDTKDSVHPYFVDIIKSMSPRDVSNLASFGNVSNAAIAEYRLKLGQSGVTTLNPYVFLRNEQYQDTENQAASISLLKTLGVVDIDFSSWFDDSSYTEFYKTKEYISHKEMAEMATQFNCDPNDIPPHVRSMMQNRSIEVRKGIITLTPVGSKLKNLCE